MTTFITSDNHFYHHNIIKFSYRPFRNTNHMNETMIRNWNGIVKESDSTIHLGDFALSSFKNIRYTRNRLNGKIYIIRGNHDRTKNRMTDAGFIVLPNQYIIKNLIFTHQPMPQVPKGFINIHGHIHEKFYDGRHINVSVEHTNYTPVSLDSILHRANEMLRLG